MSKERARQCLRLACQRSGYTWAPRIASTTRCPKCKSKYWNSPRKTRQGLRSDALSLEAELIGRVRGLFRAVDRAALETNARASATSNIQRVERQEARRRLAF